MPDAHPAESLPQIAVIGGGPAGLMAAEVLAASGRVQVTLYERMPSVGRKFLLAGRGGLNLSHGEEQSRFLQRYRQRSPELAPMLQVFAAQELRAWAAGLGVATFVGSSGRIFPVGMKAAPLLRAWLHRLRTLGVRFKLRSRWLDWQARTGRLDYVQRVLDDDHDFALRTGAATTATIITRTPRGSGTHVMQSAHADAVVLALGGASWPKFGSDGLWLAQFARRQLPVRPLLPANCGFEVRGGWSAHLRQHYAGEPLKNVSLSFLAEDGRWLSRRGECLITEWGLEGSLIYALSASLRECLQARGEVEIRLDLLPQRSLDEVRQALGQARAARSMGSHLQSRLKLKGAARALLHELLPRDAWQHADQLATCIKSLPVFLVRARPLAEAISSAGGVDFAALDQRLMLKDWPGVFCAGEMLDWEAPTGGYLLTACMATGRHAAHGVLDWLDERPV